MAPSSIRRMMTFLLEKPLYRIVPKEEGSLNGGTGHFEWDGRTFEEIVTLKRLSDVTATVHGGFGAGTSRGNMIHVGRTEETDTVMVLKLEQRTYC